MCCALAFAGAAGAQSLDAQVSPTVQDPYAQSAYGGAVVQRPSTRSVFVATLAALIAQGLGNGIGTALSQGLGGSITQWFTGAPSAGDAGMRQAFDASAKGDREMPAGLHAGVAYEVHLIGRDGATKAVDPARHVFRTGDRFQVYYRPTLPGRIDVLNVDPQGGESRIDNVEVAAGQLAALGPYQFVDAKGDETLKLVLEPCSSPVLTASTRTIVKADAAISASAPAARIGECSDRRCAACARRPARSERRRWTARPRSRSTRCPRTRSDPARSARASCALRCSIGRRRCGGGWSLQ